MTTRGEPEPPDDPARWERSLVRSRERRGESERRRRRLRRRRLLVVPVGALGLMMSSAVIAQPWHARSPMDAPWPVALGTSEALIGSIARGGDEPAGDGRRDRRVRPRLPARRGVAEARRFARSRTGLVSFAAIGDGRERYGRAAHRTFASASVVKALLLAGDLQRVARDGTGLDDSTKETLEAMIAYSDNAAADAVYARVGDPGLYEIAKHAGMESFSVSGHWTTARITAADIALFFDRLDHQFPRDHAEFAKGLLGVVIEPQRWGIPDAAARAGWNVRFKGGWRGTELGQLAHQGAELRRDGERLAIAILTDGQPSSAYAQASVRGVAARLLSPSR